MSSWVRSLVSVVEFPGPPDDGDVGHGGGTGLLPPQDEGAEQSVLGAMLLSKDAIADVIEVIRGADFYRPAHELIYDAVLDLYGRGEPVDAITVSAELTRAGDIARVGGGPYLHTLVAGVPVTANAGYYAGIVREKAILRRLVAAGTKIVQIGYTGEGQVDDIVDRAQAEVYSVTDRRASEDYAPLSDLMELTIDELEAIGNRDGAMAGVPTGFAELDDLTNGLHAGQMVIVAARPAVGKALALDTPLPTPSGWTTMGRVAVGDELIGADGSATRVVAVTDVLHDRPCYRVEFSDGSAIVADAQHQWLTTTRVRQDCLISAAGSVSAAGCASANGDAVVTTEEIARSLRCADGRANHAVHPGAALDLPEAVLPLPPYLLGACLAAGERPCAQSPRLADRLRLAVPHAHIPAAYLRASARQRRALLAGLLSMDGAATSRTGSRVRVTSQRLTSDVRELVVSLGYTCRVTTEAADVPQPGRPPVFVLTLGRRRCITGVSRVESVPVRCVQVDNPSHLYLAGASMVPTHNSTLGLDIARSASIRHGLTSVIFSLEMSRTEITMRLLSAEARIPLGNMRNGRMSDDDWNKLVRKMGEVSEAPLFIDDSPNLTMMEIRAKARRLKQRHDLRLIIVDYLQLMTSGKKVESRQVEVSEFSRQIKLLAKELEVPVVAIAQLNRGSEQRTSKRPLLSDLRESGSLEQDSDMVILLHREDMYEKESTRPGEADLIVAKHRNGPTAELVLAFQGHYSRFVDMAQN
jgi:replicative DNA helicase